MMIPNITYIDQYVSDGQTSSIRLSNLYDTLLVGDRDTDHVFRIPFDDFFIRYRQELMSIVEIYSVPESMFYRPKALSLQLYGTTELWLALLRVNNMEDITEFHQPIIYIYNPSGLMSLINMFFKREGKMT